MFNFDFHNPTHIVFGRDRLASLDTLVPRDARVLILFGGGSAKRFGTLDAVRAALGTRSVLEFGGIEPNPRYETLMKAVALARTERLDFLLAVGGGSVLDGSKFVAAAVPFPGDPAELLAHGFGPPPITEALPLGTVLTLPATGSEMNSGAVISRGDAKSPLMHPLLFPRFSILYPTLSMTLPATQVANGVVDAFVHVVEQYVTLPAEARFQDRAAEAILKTLIEVGPLTLADPNDYDARANLTWCATMALNGLVGAGVPQDWTTHMIGHELTALYHLDHAKTLAVVQPAVWRVRKAQKRAKLLQYAERVWDLRDGDEDARIDDAIAKTEAFFTSLGIATRLGAYGLGPEAIDAVVAQLAAHGLTRLGERGEVDLGVSRAILTAAL